MMISAKGCEFMILVKKNRKDHLYSQQDAQVKPKFYPDQSPPQHPNINAVMILP